MNLKKSETDDILHLLDTKQIKRITKLINIYTKNKDKEI